MYQHNGSADKKLNWKERVTVKTKQIDLRYKNMYWLLDRKTEGS